MPMVDHLVGTPEGRRALAAYIIQDERIKALQGHRIAELETLVEELSGDFTVTGFQYPPPKKYKEK